MRDAGFDGIVAGTGSAAACGVDRSSCVVVAEETVAETVSTASVFVADRSSFVVAAEEMVAETVLRVAVFVADRSSCAAAVGERAYAPSGFVEAGWDLPTVGFVAEAEAEAEVVVSGTGLVVQEELSVAKGGSKVSELAGTTDGLDVNS